MDALSTAAATAAAEWRLPEPVLIRAGMRSVFRAGDVVLRVGQPSNRFDADRRFALSLHDAGVATPLPLRRWCDEHLEVVAMQHLASLGAPSLDDWHTVGRMVRRIHGLSPEAHELPRCSEFNHWQLEDRFTALSDAIPSAAADGIAAALQRWSTWRVHAAIGTVVCHGDVHPGNVVVTENGPALIDLDLRCLGPAAWDHAALLTWEHRWKAAPGTYAAFAEGYGQSLHESEVGREFAELRLVAATLMLVEASLSDTTRSAEAATRLRYWAGDPDAPRWTPQ
jgi:Ser/Thr protein kinase RdoA (MazF antagonist)